MRFNIYIIPLALRLVLSFTLIHSVNGQEGVVDRKNTESGKGSKEAYLAIVAVGSKPDPLLLAGDKEEGKEMNSSSSPSLVRGLEPPARVYLKDVSDRRMYLKVGFHSKPSFQRIPSNKTLYLERKLTLNLAETVAYVSLPPVQTGSRAIAFLKPTGISPRYWATIPEVSLLNMDSASLKSRDIIVHNMSSSEVLFQLGTQDVEKVSSSQTVGMKSKGTARSFQHFKAVDVRDRSQYTARATLRVSPGSLNLIVFYDIDPKTNKGVSVGYLHTVVSFPASTLNKPNE